MPRLLAASALALTGRRDARPVGAAVVQPAAARGAVAPVRAWRDRGRPRSTGGPPLGGLVSARSSGPLARQIGERLAALLGVSEDLSVRLARTHSPMDATDVPRPPDGLERRGPRRRRAGRRRHPTSARRSRSCCASADRRWRSSSSSSSSPPSRSVGSGASSSSSRARASSSACSSARATRSGGALNRLAARGLGRLCAGPRRRVRPHPSGAVGGRRAAGVGGRR